MKKEINSSMRITPNQLSLLIAIIDDISQPTAYRKIRQALNPKNSSLGISKKGYVIFQ